MIRLANFDEEYLEKSWEWLRNAKLRELIASREITKEEQLTWYNNLALREDYLIWGLQIDGNPVGVCGLKNIQLDSAEYWGYIGLEKFWGKGIGSKMLELVLEEAIQRKIRNVHLLVLKNNVNALKLYEKFDFIIIEENPEGFYKMQKELW